MNIYISTWGIPLHFSTQDIFLLLLSGKETRVSLIFKVLLILSPICGTKESLFRLVAREIPSDPPLIFFGGFISASDLLRKNQDKNFLGLLFFTYILPNGGRTCPLLLLPEYTFFFLPNIFSSSPLRKRRRRRRRHSSRYKLSLPNLFYLVYLFDIYECMCFNDNSLFSVKKERAHVLLFLRGRKFRRVFDIWLISDKREKHLLQGNRSLYI